MNKRELRKFREKYDDWALEDVVTEKVRLAVHFDEKDAVKRIGAHWNPDPSGKGGYWSLLKSQLDLRMPKGVSEIVNIFDDLANITKTIEDDLPVWEWLNNNGMIYEMDRKVIPSAVEELLDRHPMGTVESHRLVFDDSEVIFTVYELPDGRMYVRQWHDVLPSEEIWHNPEQGRTAWDMLVEAGYRPVQIQETS